MSIQINSIGGKATVYPSSLTHSGSTYYVSSFNITPNVLTLEFPDQLGRSFAVENTISYFSADMSIERVGSGTIGKVATNEVIAYTPSGSSTVNWLVVTANEGYTRAGIATQNLTLRTDSLTVQG